MGLERSCVACALLHGIIHTTKPQHHCPTPGRAKAGQMQSAAECRSPAASGQRHRNKQSTSAADQRLPGVCLKDTLAGLCRCCCRCSWKPLGRRFRECFLPAKCSKNCASSRSHILQTRHKRGLFRSASTRSANSDTSAKSSTAADEPTSAGQELLLRVSGEAMIGNARPPPFQPEITSEKTGHLLCCAAAVAAALRGLVRDTGAIGTWTSLVLCCLRRQAWTLGNCVHLHAPCSQSTSA